VRLLIRKNPMKNAARRAEPISAVTRPAYRSLNGWALGMLIEQGAVRECEDHGHMRDRTDPEAWDRARDEARHNPFPGMSPEAAVAAIDVVMRSIGDSCPDCD
jgi:hypothetical protein